MHALRIAFTGFGFGAAFVAFGTAVAGGEAEGAATGADAVAGGGRLSSRWSLTPAARAAVSNAAAAASADTCSPQGMMAPPACSCAQNWSPLRYTPRKPSSGFTAG